MKVGCQEELPHVQPRSRSGLRISGKTLLLLVWTGLGLFPLLLQVRSFVHFVSPHKISRHFINAPGLPKETAELERNCPATEIYVANVYWNTVPTHYFDVDNGRLCHFVIPQYNVHGVYFLGANHAVASPNTQGDCEDDSFSLSYYLYHGSFGYYAFYEEASGSYCSKDNTMYVLVTGLGTFDSNGSALATHEATTGYHGSYWYGTVGSIWIAYRFCVLRRGLILCLRHGTRYENAQHRIRVVDAVVYVQESLRLSAHHAKNYHRLVLLYILAEGVMSELFMLIALEGFVGRLQYISLGYNLSGVMSMLFEMIESAQCLREKTRCLVKRLLFNHETVLVGEIVCAGAMQRYLTSLNRTGLKDTTPQAEVASYYVWGLIGHGCIVGGCVLVLVVVRALGAVLYIQYRFRSLAVLVEPCCVDTTMGVRCKLLMLAGYIYENGKLYYRSSTLATLGILRVVEEDSSEHLAFHTLHWISPGDDLLVIGIVSNQRVTPCQERPCAGLVSLFGHKLGGSIEESNHRQRLAKNRVTAGPTPLDLFPLEVTQR